MSRSKVTVISVSVGSVSIAPRAGTVSTIRAGRRMAQAQMPPGSSVSASGTVQRDAFPRRARECRHGQRQQSGEVAGGGKGVAEAVLAPTAPDGADPLEQPIVDSKDTHSGP